MLSHQLIIRYIQQPAWLTLLALLLIGGRWAAEMLSSRAVNNYILGGQGWKMIVGWYQTHSE
jgi:hypothetical protein